MKEDNLIALVTKYRLTLPGTRAGYDVLPWRACGEKRGTIPSLNIHCRIICTNGIVAWFVNGDGTTFWGHLSNFIEHKRPPGVCAFWKVGAERKPREKTERQKREEELLASL